MTRRDKEVAYNAELISPGGAVADAAINVMLKELPEGEERVHRVCVSQENGKEIYLNVEVHLPDGSVGDMKNMGLKDELGGGHEVLDHDHFDLATIIEAIMNKSKGKTFFSGGGVCGACDVC